MPSFRYRLEETIATPGSQAECLSTGTVLRGFIAAGYMQQCQLICYINTHILACGDFHGATSSPDLHEYP